MKKISIICFSPSGLNTAEILAEKLKNCINEVSIDVKGSFSKDSISDSLGQWTEKHFSDDALIFVGSTGIAVRAIAPYVDSKKTDPAVIVVDDMLQNVIPILSGHLGGANELARLLAEGTGANAVITTSTDIHGKFAPDVFAKKNNLIITDFEKAKAAAAALVRGEGIVILTDMPVTQPVPPEITVKPLGNASRTDDKFTIIISMYTRDLHGDFDRTLVLIPKNLVLGIGLKEGKSSEELKTAVSRALREARIFTSEAIGGIASIDIKEKEQGLHDLADELGCELKFYTAEELKAVEGEFTESEFVREITGVGSVCERSAALMAGTDSDGLILRKFANDGVTVAAAVKKGTISFE